MPVSAGTTTTLAAPLARSATTARFALDMAALCTQTLTQHVVVTIYSARYSEQLLITGCQPVNGVQHATVQRGFNGTSARDWPLDACVCVAEVRPACGNGDDDDDDEDTCCPDPMAGVVAEGCIEIDRTNPKAPIIRLKSTGVAPVDTPCIKINECGLVERVSPGFPGDCLPVFSPCTPCDGGGTGGPVTAQQVSFTATGTEFATGPSVFSALVQLDAALQAIVAGTSGIVGISAGTGISIGGTSTLPVVSLAPLHATPSTTGGLSYDVYGRVTGYNPPATPTVPAHAAAAPATISLAGNTYTHGVAQATDAAFGVVKLAEAAALAAGAADPTDVITVATLPSNNVNLAALAAVVAHSDGTFIPIIDGGTASKKQLREDFMRDIGATYAAGEFTTTATGGGTTAALVVTKNVSNVSVPLPNVFEVTMASPGALTASYVAYGQVIGDSNPWLVGFERISATVFRLRVHDLGATGGTPPRVLFNVFATE